MWHVQKTQIIVLAYFLCWNMIHCTTRSEACLCCIEVTGKLEVAGSDLETLFSKHWKDSYRDLVTLRDFYSKVLHISFVLELVI